MQKTVLVIGASGVVGTSTMEYFDAHSDWDVIGISRRPPLVPLRRSTHHSLDLTDEKACSDLFGGMSSVTHLVYAAVNERDDDVVGGWSDPAQIAKNAMMLRNVVDPLTSAARNFQHVVLIHGGKAYGVHLPGMDLPLPLREDLPRHIGQNFYYEQEDYIAAKAAGQNWSWTILRPDQIIGPSVASSLSSLLILALFAALRREAGLDMPAPSGCSVVHDMTDAALVAEATEWAMTAPTAKGQAFNLTNGDIFRQHDAIPIIAKAMDMPVGAPRNFDMQEEFDRLAHLWPGMVERYNLNVPAKLDDVLGNSRQLAGGWYASVAPGEELRWGVLSTIKIRQAGFAACIDSAEMLHRYVTRFKELGIIP